ncbi:MAG: hypothetical protein OXU23_06640 [Candidatus Poribacteria bacterium]|nr:hypothetical protein [Candidatus Poribacteria bacterium]
MKKKKHEVFPHFSVEVLREKYLECECPRERTHWHIIWLLADTTHPRTPREVDEGETYWKLLMPCVSVEVMNLALAEFARDVTPDGKKQVILLLDRAGFHTGKGLEVPKGLSYFIYRRIHLNSNLLNGYDIC